MAPNTAISQCIDDSGFLERLPAILLDLSRFADNTPLITRAQPQHPPVNPLIQKHMLMSVFSRVLDGDEAFLKQRMRPDQHTQMLSALEGYTWQRNITGCYPGDDSAPISAVLNTAAGLYHSFSAVLMDTSPPSAPPPHFRFSELLPPDRKYDYYNWDIPDTTQQNTEKDQSNHDTKESPSTPQKTEESKKRTDTTKKDETDTPSALTNTTSKQNTPPPKRPVQKATPKKEAEETKEESSDLSKDKDQKKKSVPGKEKGTKKQKKGKKGDG